ncbi:MAG TPA: hypothetical protein VMG82_26810 [Candidatus Sulfotelmatobacter sp.]|nr:hypothetical protein [Candidatus Sulfotelmatobacter sp.]
MGKIKWGTIVVLCALSVGSVVADEGRLRANAQQELSVNEQITGTIKTIAGKRLRITEDPDPMGCATSGIKMVDIVERTRLFRGDAVISDSDLQRGDHVTVDAALRGETLEAIEIRVQDLTAPDHRH